MPWVLERTWVIHIQKNLWIQYMLDLLKDYRNCFLLSLVKNHLNEHKIYCNFWFLIEKSFRNLSSLLRNLTYLSLLNSFLFLSRFSVSLKSLDNYFFRWFAYKSFLSRYSVLINYNMWSSNHFSTSSRFPRFSGSRFFRVQVFQCPGFSGSWSRVRVQILGVAIKIRFTFLCNILHFVT